MRKFESIAIEDATPLQLRVYAESFLGIPLTDKDDDASVLAKVTAANEGHHIFAGSALPATDQTGSEPVNPAENTSGGNIVGSLGREDPKVTLTLHAEDRDGVVISRHKDVGVNGVVWLLARGQSITIPYRVFLALDNAERHVITMTTDGETREQRVKNTPFNVERMPPADEIAAWHAKTDAQFVP